MFREAFNAFQPPAVATPMLVRMQEEVFIGNRTLNAGIGYKEAELRRSEAFSAKSRALQDEGIIGADEDHRILIVHVEECVAWEGGRWEGERGGCWGGEGCRGVSGELGDVCGWEGISGSRGVSGEPRVRRILLDREGWNVRTSFIE